LFIFDESSQGQESAPTPELSSDETTQPDNSEQETNVGSSEIIDGSIDATPFNTPENAVPLGTWVYLKTRNFESSEPELLHLRITGIIRDADEVERRLETYTGMWVLSLDEEDAQIMEFVIVEFDIRFPEDWSSHERGIRVPSLSLSLRPIATPAFRLDGTSYIGVGNGYPFRTLSTEEPHPGDTIHEQTAFAVLKHYDSKDIVVYITWYDGEISNENNRPLYMAVA